LTDRDRPTPRDPLPAAQAAPGRASREDDQRLIREAESAARKRTGAIPPPPLPRPQERKQTPVSGGIEAQAKPSTIEIAEAPASKAPSRTDWLKLAFKLGVALVGLIGAVTTLLAIRANTAIEPKVEAQKTRTDAVEIRVDDRDARLAKVEAWARGEAKRRECVEKQLRDALARGTGHVLMSLPSGGTAWVEQNKARAQLRTIWITPTWFTTEVCEPAPPPP
jgi:hypothetical protein